MSPLPTPERVGCGPRHWFVWFVVKAANGREFKLRMVPR